MNIVRAFLLVSLASFGGAPTSAEAPPTIQFDATIEAISGDSSAWSRSLALGDPIQAKLIPRQIESGLGFTYRPELELVLPDGRLHAPWFRVSIFEVIGYDETGSYTGISVGCSTGTESPYCSMGYLEGQTTRAWTASILLLGATNGLETISPFQSEERLNSLNIEREIRLNLWEYSDGFGDPLYSVVARVGAVTLTVPEPQSVILALTLAAAAPRRSPS